MKDYFSVLGIEASSSADEIKRAYRNLAMKHHPDRGGDQARFQEIQEAYDVLSNPQKRAEWEAQKHHNQFNRAGGPNHFSFNFGFGGINIDDVFRAAFHGGADPFSQFSARQRKNRDLRIVIELDLASTLDKQTKYVSVQHLNGHRESVSVEIPRGINSNMQMKYAGHGDKSMPDVPPGDLYIEFRIIPDNDFTIEGIDLIKKIKINCLEAITGTTVNIRSLEGKELSWSIPVGTQHGSKFRIPNYGLWAVDHPMRGSLIVLVETYVPNDLTTEELLIIEDLVKNKKGK